MRLTIRANYILPILVFLLLSPALSRAQDEQQFYQTYVRHAFDALANPAAANMRVRSIWMELAGYSKHMFPVYPAEQFTLGHATLQGIYLDLSVAADPSVEVTRFWLAHEWGHMMHGDPLSALTLVGQYQMATGGTKVEDAADTYAATFMRYNGHDIKPVIEYLCGLPGGGEGDTHGTGTERAVHVARIYGVPDRKIDVPCAPTTSSAGRSDPDKTASDDTASNSGSTNSADDQEVEEALSKCQRSYEACIAKIISVDQCVANNVGACSKTCTAGPLYCDCSPARFRPGCAEVLRDEPEECRDRRSRCEGDARPSDN